MLKQVREKIITLLWQQYRSTLLPVQQIEAALRERAIFKLPLDHFAVIDLPGKHTGIDPLCQIFLALGYSVKGQGYLPDKQNAFLWMHELDCEKKPPDQVLPQAVVADFCLDALPLEVRKIIEKYAALAPPSPLAVIKNLATKVYQHDTSAIEPLIDCVVHYFRGPDWPAPTLKEFKTVNEFNELLAWVLVFGRQPNHFTFSIHLLQAFSSLLEFSQFVKTLNIPLNDRDGLVKGHKKNGIEQSATQSCPLSVALADASILLPDRFVEFVWRYPKKELARVSCWDDYFTDFLPQQADRVIESVYSS